MNLDSRTVLARLGAGEPLETVCAAAGLSREDFQTWWQSETRGRVPDQSGSREAMVGADVGIDRDRWGIPRISADTDEDLFFGFGYAMAQDRLFQLDYLRRKASGRLSEVLGPDGLELDVAARTIGIRRIAEAEWETTPAETKRLLTAFSGGIDESIAAAGERLPIEFDLLDYAPEPWTPVDCLAIAGEFRAYLTVRLPVIFIPELGRRVLGDGALYRAFLQGEADDESILPPGSYPAGSAGPAGTRPVGATVADASEGVGSNNWVIAGSHPSGTRVTTVRGCTWTSSRCAPRPACRSCCTPLPDMPIRASGRRPSGWRSGTAAWKPIASARRFSRCSSVTGARGWPPSGSPPTPWRW